MSSFAAVITVHVMNGHQLKSIVIDEEMLESMLGKKTHLKPSPVRANRTYSWKKKQEEVNVLWAAVFCFEVVTLSLTYTRKDIHTIQHMLPVLQYNKNRTNKAEKVNRILPL